MQGPADRYIQSTQMGLVLTQKAARSKTFCLTGTFEHLYVVILPVGCDMNMEDWFLNPLFLIWEIGLEFPGEDLIVCYSQSASLFLPLLKISTILSHSNTLNIFMLGLHPMWVYSLDWFYSRGQEQQKHRVQTQSWQEAPSMYVSVPPCHIQEHTSDSPYRSGQGRTTRQGLQTILCWGWICQQETVNVLTCD